jgi:hypothetical protein
METAAKFITPGIIFILTLAAGVWLSHSGRPLNTIIITIHKLIALAAVVVTAIQVYGLLKNTEIQTLLILLMTLTGLCVVALFATGALLSAVKPVSDKLLTIHKAAPFLAVISMAATVYLLAGNRL